MRPIHSFIVGCPRSGTTRLQYLLASQPDVMTFPESHFFNVLEDLPFSQRWYVTEHPFLDLRSFRDWVRKHYPSVRVPALLITRKSAAIRFLRCLDRIASANRRKIWIEKTPNHIASINEITSASKNAKFIHLIRDPVDVVASLLDVSGKYKEVWNFNTVEKALQRWEFAAEISLIHVDKPGHMVVIYEELANSEDRVIAEVMEFLGGKLEKPCPPPADALVNDNEPWKSRATNSRTELTKGKADFLLSQSDKSLIRQRALEKYQSLFESACTRETVRQVSECCDVM
ncbi:MAG: sulfotransferase family protein [Aureliella sp.]